MHLGQTYLKSEQQFGLLQQDISVQLGRCNQEMSEKAQNTGHVRESPSPRKKLLFDLSDICVCS